MLLEPLPPRATDKLRVKCDFCGREWKQQRRYAEKSEKHKCQKCVLVEVRRKGKAKCKKLHGVENYMQTAEGKKKSTDKMVEKYGVEYPLQSDEIKAAWLERRLNGE